MGLEGTIVKDGQIYQVPFPPLSVQVVHIVLMVQTLVSAT